MEVHRTDPNMVDAEIDSVHKLYAKMLENIIESTVAGDFYRLLKGVQELSEVVGIKEVS
jgi:hypothetical protein